MYAGILHLISLALVLNRTTYFVTEWQMCKKKLLYKNIGKFYLGIFMNLLENINFKAISSFGNDQNKNNTYSGLIKPNDYGLQDDVVEINKTDISENEDNKSKFLKMGAVVGSGIAAVTIGIFTAKHSSLKNVKKVVEKLKKLKFQELEKSKAEELKKAEEARIAQEKAQKAQQEAIKAQQEAREKAIQEAKQKAEKEAKIKAEQEAKIKAEKQAQLEAARKAKDANRKFEYNTENEVAQYIDPKRAIRNNIEQKEGESFSDYLKRSKESSENIDNFDFGRRIENTEPDTVFNVVFEQFEKCHENGGTASVDDFIKTLERTKSTMDITYDDLYRQSPYGTTTIYNKFSDYKKYIDKVVTEIKSTNSEGDSAPNVVRKALKNLENKKIARQNYVGEISQHYEQELGTIRGRLKYDEANVLPIHKNVTISTEEKQKLVDELNSMLESGGEHPNFTIDTPLSTLNAAWKKKYISIPFSMNNAQTGETAVLDLFPRYRSGISHVDGKDFPFKTSGDFKYEPLYRQMHVENPEEFIKQFENIGGEYAPGKLQSCSKAKLFGEAWGSLGNRQYGFTEWAEGNNVKFVIHPKGAVSNAAEIGEGKYGSYEAIYAPDSKFRIIGTIKKTVTPEGIQREMPDFRGEFGDFTKYEIHLQEM